MEQPKQPMTILNLKIMWFAIIGSNFLYGAMLLMRPVEEHFPIDRVRPQMIPIMSSLGIVMLIVAILLPRHQLEKEKKKQQQMIDMEMMKINAIDGLLPIFTTPFILRLSLFQSVSLFGFILGMTQNNIIYFYPFALVSLTASLLNFPTEENIRLAFNR